MRTSPSVYWPWGLCSSLLMHAFFVWEEGSVVMTIVEHVDDIFAVGERARCDQFDKDLHQMVPVKNLGELRWYSGCFYERDWEKGVLKISLQTFAEQLADEYGI